MTGMHYRSPRPRPHHLPFRNGSFDAVMSNVAIHMFPDSVTRVAVGEVTRLVRADFHVFVHSCRAAWGGGRAQIEAWLEANDFPDLDVVPKPRADVYLDDRAIRFDDWPSAYTRIIREEGRQS